MGSIHTHSNNRLVRRRATGAFLIATTLALAACGGGDDDSTAASDFAGPEAEAPADRSGAAGGNDSGLAAGYGSADEATTNPEGSTPTERTEGGFDLGIVGRDVIIEMRVVVSSDDIARSVASITANAATLGGGVASSDVNYGAGEEGEDGLSEGFAVLVVKVPPEAVDRLLAGLDDTGEVQSINQSAQDVTEQLVDLDVRIANARQSVANVREFMERAEDLNDLVTLESELTRRQTELEQLEAKQRNLSDRVALSTITIELLPTAAVPVDESPDTIRDAFGAGFEAFLAVLFGLGFVLAIMTPFLVVGVVIAALTWLILRTRRSPTPVEPTAEPLGAEPLGAEPHGADPESGEQREADHELTDH